MAHGGESEGRAEVMLRVGGLGSHRDGRAIFLPGDSGNERNWEGAEAGMEQAEARA